MNADMDVQVPKPKLEMVVPYKEYKLVHSDGSIPERIMKHPFCMSRVHYSETGQSPHWCCIRLLPAAPSRVVIVLCCSRLFTWQQLPTKSVAKLYLCKEQAHRCSCCIHLQCTPCPEHIPTTHIYTAQTWVVSRHGVIGFAAWSHEAQVTSLCCGCVQRGGRRYGPSWQMAHADGGRPALPSRCCASESLLTPQLSTCSLLWIPTSSEVPHRTCCSWQCTLCCAHRPGARQITSWAPSGLSCMSTLSAAVAHYTMPSLPNLLLLPLAAPSFPPVPLPATPMSG